MQAIAPVTTDQLLQKGQQPLLKFEIFYGCCWVDLTDLGGKNYLKSISISTAGAEMTPNPVAGSWSATIFNKNGMFDPDEAAYAPYNEYFRAGVKVKIQVGAKYGGVDYYWRRIYGFMEVPNFSIDKSEVNLQGFDNMQFLTDTKLRMPDNYWGGSQTFSSVSTEGTLGAEIYAETDAMEIGAGEANNVANWTPTNATFTSVADGGGGSTWVGHLVITVAKGYTKNLDVGNAILNSEYKVTFKYRRVVGAGPMSVQIRQTSGGSEVVCGGKSALTSDIWATESFFFTALATGPIIMRVGWGDINNEFKIDEISIKLHTPGTWHRYTLPDACLGIHYATLDDSPVWPGKQKGEGWYYDSEFNQFYFDEDKDVEAGAANLKIHYYTVQIPENVVADLLVRAGLYGNQAEALAAMIYTATAITIDKVWFKEGEAAINAVRMLCERCNYRFYFNYGQRPVFKPAPAPISTCDATTDWTGTDLSIDTVDKKAGTGSLKDASPVPPVINTVYYTRYNPAGTWDWSAKKHILFWLKSDRARTAFTLADLIIYDTGGNWRLWNLTFAAGVWTAIKKLLSTGDSESGVAPDLALINIVQIYFKTADTTPFYKKIDDVRVTDFNFTESHITNIRDYEDRNEIRNRVVIEGIEQAMPEGAEETKPSKLKGEASEVASINKYGEHTWPIKNHLFQDQATIDAYCAIYLAAFKDPKWYTTFDTPFNPVPLEKGDTDTWRKQYEAGGTPIDQRGIIRDIQINDFTVTYKNEKVA